MKLEEMKTKNYYEILGVKQSASAEEIRNAYARAVAKYHPDINPGVDNSEIMKLCRKAYATLKEETLRKQYDESLKAKAIASKPAQKNYYTVLGIKPEATEEEIKAAFTKAVVDSEINGKSAEEMKQIKEAYEVLKDKEKRAEYDKQLGIKNAPVAIESSPKVSNLEVKASKNWFQRNKGKLITTGILIAGFVVGSLVGAHWNSHPAEPNSITTSSETPTPTPQAEVEEKITAQNIDTKVEEIVKDNKTKGFSIDPEMVKAALFITNVDYMEPQDIYDIFAYQLDGIESNDTRMMIISEEIQKMYDYVSAVRTHNNNGGEYISMVNLAYDKEDIAVLEELDTEYRDLVADLKSGEITEAEYQESFKYITDFYTGKGYLNTKGNEYSNYSMTAGGGLLSEAYWPMFAVAYKSSELETKENAIDIKTLSEGTKDSDAVVNGSKYLGSIIGAINNCTTYLTPEEPEMDKTVTK